MRTAIFLMLLAAASAIVADDLQCNGCVHTDDIRNQAVTTQKIQKGAVTEGKLAPKVLHKMKRPIVRDGVGRELPFYVLEVSGQFSNFGVGGLYTLDTGEVFPLIVTGSDFSLQSHLSWVYFDGPDCTGNGFFGPQVNESTLYKAGIIRDPLPSRRSFRVYRLGQQVAVTPTLLSVVQNGSECVEIISVLFPGYWVNVFEAVKGELIKWQPPYRVEVP